MRYGTFKYGTAKYGEYELPTDQEHALGQGVRYRIRTIDSTKRESPMIQNTSITFPVPYKPTRIRIRSNKSEYVTSQSMDINGNIRRVRVQSIGVEYKSPWVEAVIGTIKLKEGN